MWGETWRCQVDWNILPQRCSAGFKSGERRDQSLLSIPSSSRDCLHSLTTWGQALLWTRRNPGPTAWVTMGPRIRTFYGTYSRVILEKLDYLFNLSRVHVALVPSPLREIKVLFWWGVRLKLCYMINRFSMSVSISRQFQSSCYVKHTSYFWVQILCHFSKANKNWCTTESLKGFRHANISLTKKQIENVHSELNSLLNNTRQCVLGQNNF